MPRIGTPEPTVRDTAANRYLMCDGATYQIADYDRLYDVIGIKYGGDGVTTFKVPDCRNRFILGAGDNPLGSSGGEAEVTLSVNQMPAHGHQMQALADEANEDDPTNAWPSGDNSGDKIYTTDEDALDSQMAPSEDVGGNQPHNNMPPWVTFNWMIYAGQ